jgi:hypothetical protein
MGLATACALCGLVFDAAAVRRGGACARCPLGGGCEVACCPRCGYATPVVERSALVRLFDRLFQRRRA